VRVRAPGTPALAMRPAMVTGLLLALLLVGLAPGPASAGPAGADGDKASKQLQRCSQLVLIAHRGIHDKAHTEDSRAAFKRAIRKGVQVVEGDIRLSADGSWVFMHDPRVNRTTHGRGLVRELTDAQLAGIRMNDHRRGVTTLVQVLDLIRRSPGRHLEIEVKTKDAPADRLLHLQQLLGAYGLQGRVLVTSFHADVLTTLRGLGSWPTALISTDPTMTPERAAAYGSTVVLSAHASQRLTLERFRTAGMRVESWTVDSRRSWRRMVVRGTDAVITNRVQPMRGWCRKAR
jgi:glycerophosphoryl diester phosphodiesterase